MRIDILHVPGCPSVAAARSRLQQALARLGLSAEIREREVSTAEEAELVGMRGSPTIAVDGRDLFTGPDASLACRLYRDGYGVDGAPTVEALVATLGPTTDAMGCCNPSGGDLLHAGLSEVARRLSVAGFAALWEGRVAEPAVLLVDTPVEATVAAKELAGYGRAELDDDGRLRGIHGLTFAMTRHSFRHEGVARYTWCAFDSVGIPAALGLDATATTDCPACGSTITMKIEAGQVVHGEGVLWLPDADGVAHLMNDFCAAAALYCSREHLEAHVGAARPDGEMVTLDEAVALGRATWADVAGIDVNGVLKAWSPTDAGL